MSTLLNGTEPCLFVTGTDTDVGKTVATAAILRRLINNGIQAVAMKPIQTGCTYDEKGELRVPDLEVYEKAIAKVYPEEQKKILAPYRYRPACSPHLAASTTQVSPSIDHICHCVSLLRTRFQTVLVEGAGGLLVPLNERESMLDLIKALGAPVLLVAANKLGMINHTLLTANCLEQNDIPIKGIVLTHTSAIASDEEKTIRMDNRDVVCQRTGLDILAEIEYVEGFNAGSPESWKMIDACMK